MFDFLKKKISGFIDSLTKKEEEKAEEPVKEEKIEKPKIEEKAPEPEIKKEKIKKIVQPPKEEKPAPKKEEIKKERKVEPPKPEKKPEAPKQENAEPKVEKIETPAPQPPPKQAAEEKERIKLGAISTIKSLISREVEIGEGDVKGLLENFELELLEADVDLSVAESIREELREKLIGAKTKKDDLHPFVSRAIKETLTDIISNDKVFDIVDRVSESEKPVKIMFFGINGAGKTTTIAKVGKRLMDRGHKVVFAAADTFRAAAIEQMSVHSERLGVKMIKREYGSDPTSVAYDAVNYAKAHSIDAVLIDTAGRQDTNISLINEMKKMDRVIHPDLKIYIGESIAGNAMIEQISSFNREIGIDAVILTKLDCDPKGGTMLSINKATGIPVIYLGTGQSYDDLEPFDAVKIVDRIVA